MLANSAGTRPPYPIVKNLIKLRSAKVLIFRSRPQAHRYSDDPVQVAMRAI
jgi:hypothetical protein